MSSTIRSGACLASVDENYFRQIQQADWKKQYLDSHGNVQTRGGLLTRILRACIWLLPDCIKSYFQPNLVTARACLVVRMADYSEKASELKRGDREDLLRKVATKFNDIINKKPALSDTMMITSDFLRTLPLFQSTGTPGGPAPSLYSSSLGINQDPHR